MGHRNRPLPPPLGCSHSITGMDLRPHRGPVCCDRCQPLEAGPRRKARAHARTMTGNRSTRRKPLKVTIERRDEDFAEAQSQVALVAVRSSVAAARRPGAVPATRRSAPKPLRSEFARGADYAYPELAVVLLLPGNWRRVPELARGSAARVLQRDVQRSRKQRMYKCALGTALVSLTGRRKTCRRRARR
jgi:hypothetical protein